MLQSRCVKKGINNTCTILRQGNIQSFKFMSEHYNINFLARPQIKAGTPIKRPLRARRLIEKIRYLSSELCGRHALFTEQAFVHTLHADPTSIEIWSFYDIHFLWFVVGLVSLSRKVKCNLHAHLVLRGCRAFLSTITWRLKQAFPRRRRILKPLS